MTEYYIVINDAECGPKVLEYISGQKACGRVERIGTYSYKINCATEREQQAIFDALAEAMDEDFPPTCDYCGGAEDECCCEDESTDPQDEEGKT